ncbi:MAG: hypothetical protein ACK5T0_06420 [Vampirovibrionales bacterium]|jgi:dimeric dUTPase (all-alpha-NTP-PPase superfamily)
MLLQRNGAYVRRVYSTLPTFTSLEDPQRVQNCVELEQELRFQYFRSLFALKKKETSKNIDSLHQAYISLIEALNRCQRAGIETPSYVNDCIDDLVEKAFASKKDAPNKMGFSELA